jgi:hypothetical protein
MTKSHDVPAQLAGYIFQFERALLWLVEAPLEARIGIEAGDDVVLETATEVFRQQDKHTSVETGYRLGDNTADLWKTLANWLEALQADETGKATRLFLITNGSVNPDSFAAKLFRSEPPPSGKQLVRSLREVGAETPIGVQKYVDRVLQASDEVLCSCLEKIEVIQTRSDSDRLKILTTLGIPDKNFPADEFYKAMLGWLVDSAVLCWRAREVAWITKRQFIDFSHSLRLLLADRKVRVKMRHLLDVGSLVKGDHSARIFIRQLDLIDSSAESIIDALTDYFGSDSEFAQLSKQGDVTKDEVIAFRGRLKERWKTISARILRQGGTRPSEEIGRDIFEDTMDHRESLAHQPTEEYYLTRGAYHLLSDLLEIGWHPEYKEKFK